MATWHGEMNYGETPTRPLLSPVKSFICFQSLIIFLITVFVPGETFETETKVEFFF